jgi:hypothetical protein
VQQDGERMAGHGQSTTRQERRCLTHGSIAVGSGGLCPPEAGAGGLGPFEGSK